MSKEILDAIAGMATKADIEAPIAEVKSSVGEVKSVVEEVKGSTDELSIRVKELEAKSTKPQPKDEFKSIGKQFSESEAYKAVVEGKSKTARIEVKAPTTNAEAQTYSQRLMGVVPKPLEGLNLLAVIPTGTATSNSIDYVRENTWVDGSAPQAGEGAVKGESTFDFETINTPVETVAHWTKMSKQMMQDNSAVVSFINQRMPYGVAKNIETQVITGTGLSNQLKGLTHVDNHTVYTPAAASGAFENLRRALADMEVLNHTPSYILMNPADVAELDLEAASDGHYIAADARTYNTPIAWGVPIVKTQAVAAGKFFIIDASQVTLWLRSGMEVESTQYDQDDFTKNLYTVRAEQRCALTVYNKTGVIYGDLVGA